MVGEHLIYCFDLTSDLGIVKQTKSEGVISGVAEPLTFMEVFGSSQIAGSSSPFPSHLSFQFSSCSLPLLSSLSWTSLPVRMQITD